MSQLKRADSQGGQDRRAAPRLLVDLEVDYRSEDNFLFAYITDISETGIFIRTTTPEPAGTYLNLRFTPPVDVDAPSLIDLGLSPDDEAVLACQPLELEGEVIWINPYRPGAPDSLSPGMGVRFRAIDGETKHRLLDLVRRIAYLT